MKLKCTGKGWTSDTAFEVYTVKSGTCATCGQHVRSTVQHVPKVHYVEEETHDTDQSSKAVYA